MIASQIGFPSTSIRRFCLMNTSPRQNVDAPVAVHKWQECKSPLLASQQGGVAERSRKYRGASAHREAGVVFRSRHARKTTPSAPVKEASRHLIYGAATPPCSDARRGILHSCNSFTPSITDRFLLIQRNTRGRRTPVQSGRIQKVFTCSRETDF